MREENTVTIASIDEKKILKTKNKSPSEYHESEFIYAKKALLLLNKIIMDAQRTTKDSCPLLGEVNKYLHLLSNNSSNNAKGKDPMYFYVLRFEGMACICSFSDVSSEALIQRQKKSSTLTDEKEKSLKFFSAKYYRPINVFEAISKRLTITSGTRDRLYVEQAQFEIFERDKYIHPLENNIILTEEDGKVRMYFSDKGHRLRLANLSVISFELCQKAALSDQAPSLKGESATAEESMYLSKTFLAQTEIDTEIDIRVQQEFGDGAYHTVKEVVMTLLGGLQDAAAHAIAQVIDFKCPRNQMVHFYQMLLQFDRKGCSFPLCLILVLDAARLFSRRKFGLTELISGKFRFEAKRLCNIFTWKINTSITDIILLLKMQRSCDRRN